MLLHGNDIFDERGFHIAETILAENMKTYLHSHDFYEMFLITEGQIHHFINDEKRSISTNVLCFVSPEDEHQFSKAGDISAHFLNIAFPCETMKLALSVVSAILGVSVGESSFMPETELSDYDAATVLTKLKQLSDNKDFIDRDKLHALLLSFLIDALLRLFPYERSAHMAPAWLREACEEMKKEENYKAGLERFVLLAGKSKEHLNRSVKKYYGMRPSEMLNKIRLDAVAEKLKVSDESVLEIMLQCGFNNVSYFNRLFRSVYGITPREFRKRNHGIVDPSVLK